MGIDRKGDSVMPLADAKALGFDFNGAKFRLWAGFLKKRPRP